MSPVLAPTSPNDPQRKPDRKSTRLNSSHGYISYAVFCLKKKKTKQNDDVIPTKRHNNIENADAMLSRYSNTHKLPYFHIRITTYSKYCAPTVLVLIHDVY